MYILDANVVSEMRKTRNGKADINVVAWAETIPSTSLFVFSITILEIETGILLLKRRDPGQYAVLREWMDGYVLPTFSKRILPFDTAVAMCCAKLHIPNPRPHGDAVIAATAIVHSMQVVTRNVSDFEPMGVITINPWDFGISDEFDHAPKSITSP